jgi:hypothetical protein
MAQATCLHDTGARVNWAVKIPDTLITIPLDQSDLAEALGAVIQNAARHIKSAVRACLRVTATGPCLCVNLHFPTPPPQRFETELVRANMMPKPVKFHCTTAGSDN